MIVDSARDSLQSQPSAWRAASGSQPGARASDAVDTLPSPHELTWSNMTGTEAADGTATQNEAQRRRWPAQKGVLNATSQSLSDAQGAAGQADKAVAQGARSEARSAQDAASDAAPPAQPQPQPPLQQHTDIASALSAHNADATPASMRSTTLSDRHSRLTSRHFSIPEHHELTEDRDAAEMVMALPAVVAELEAQQAPAEPAPAAETHVPPALGLQRGEGSAPSEPGEGAVCTPNHKEDDLATRSALLRSMSSPASSRESV